MKLIFWISLVVCIIAIFLLIYFIVMYFRKKEKFVNYECDPADSKNEIDHITKNAGANIELTTKNAKPLDEFIGRYKNVFSNIISEDFLGFYVNRRVNPDLVPSPSLLMGKNLSQVGVGPRQNLNDVTTVAKNLAPSFPSSSSSNSAVQKKENSVPPPNTFQSKMMLAANGNATS